MSKKYLLPNPIKKTGTDLEIEKKPNFDAILVLGAVMEWDKQRKQWTFPTIINRYAGKLVMGKARALAAREIQKKAPFLLIAGGSDTNPETGKIESRSFQLAKLITDQYGVSKEKVIPIGAAGADNTLGNVENLIAYLESHPDILKLKKIAVLSPRFQKERARLMFEKNPYFNKCGIELEWLVVEDILEKCDPRYKKWIDAVYATPEAEINRQIEARGLDDLKSGKYGKKTG